MPDEQVVAMPYRRMHVRVTEPGEKAEKLAPVGFLIVTFEQQYRLVSTEQLLCTAKDVE